MIKGIHHPGIGVRDMETSLRFYRDLLGLTVSADMELEGPVLDDIVSLKNARVRIVHLLCSDDQEVELFEYTRPASSTFPKDHRQCDGGIIHVAFRVDNLMELCRKLKDNGVRFNSEPYDLGGTLCVYLHDPDGITIELLQPDVEP
jgi:catechol 2,3-dioxygenase-like lactoylglutathione lyase family enzyme